MKKMGSKTRDQLAPITFAFVILLSFTLSLSAHALSFASVTGSGDLIISVTGDAYFDSLPLDLTDLTLSASTSIVIGDAFPSGVPGTPTDTIDLRDVIGATDVSILGDAYFAEFDFAGRLAIQADRIHIVGPLIAVGSITLTSDTISIDAGTSDAACSARITRADLMISIGSADATDALCDPGTVLTPGTGIIFIPDGGLIISRAVPEPSAALLFTAGIVSFAAWNRRR